MNARMITFQSYYFIPKCDGAIGIGQMSSGITLLHVYESGNLAASRYIVSMVLFRMVGRIPRS